MDHNSTNVIRVSLECCDLLGCVVIIDAKVEVIGAAYNPVLPSDEAASANRDICEFEGFDNCLAQVSSGLV